MELSTSAHGLANRQSESVEELGTQVSCGCDLAWPNTRVPKSFCGVRACEAGCESSMAVQIRYEASIMTGG